MDILTAQKMPMLHALAFLSERMNLQNMLNSGRQDNTREDPSAEYEAFQKHYSSEARLPKEGGEE
ncbi:hypothetical protein F892_03118 [Acinetobacter vivianii]|uniref:Uncharacterized protein n=1 Tax=Acinetobacter vivianii TaxID=1776742 RepID=N9Q142_9GAMM|nr:hypothetical protein [Acinetobacter vivianii]ENX20195.1 hypothetical protein F892_03118 [Acinetobacter vivianii]GGI59357.1 hypothetical protein GCM10011446_08520 [Acinetobacter vivianii]